MLTIDLALIHDDIYKQIVYDFANDLSALDSAFRPVSVWEKVTTNGGGFAQNKFCVDATELIDFILNNYLVH